MKKLLGSTLTLALLFPYSQANAELLKNFKFSGEIETEMQASRNVLDFATRHAKDVGAAIGSSQNDRLNNAQTRVLLNIDWDLLDDVHAKVTLRKNDLTWGGTGATIAGAAPNSAGAGQSHGSQSITTSGAAGGLLGNIWIDQAYLKVTKVFGWVDATVGRQFYGDPGDLIIYYGPQDKLYGLPSTALDSVRVDWAGESLNITALASKQQGSGLATAPENVLLANNDVDVRGFKVGYKVMDGLMINAHLYNKLTHANGALGSDQPGGHNDNLYVYGAKAKWEGGGLGLSFEFDKNNGENRTTVYGTNPNGSPALADAVGNGYAASEPTVGIYEGYAWKFDADYKAEIEGIASLMPWFNFSWGSGRGSTTENKNEGFYSINGDWRPGAIYGRFAPSGAIALGSQIQCLVGAPDCSAGGVLGGGAFYRQNTGVESALNPDGSYNSLNNRIIWGFGMKVTPAALSQLTLGLQIWDFRIQRITKTFVDGIPVGTSFGGLPNGAGKNGKNFTSNGHGNNFKTLGDEVDFEATWKHSDNVSFTAGAGGFAPGRWIKSIMTDSVNGVAVPEVGISNVVMAWCDIKVKF